jgi:hypothetical protein
MSRFRSAAASASVATFALYASLSAQSAGQTTPSAAAAAQSPVVTVEGCLMREADVPGRKPNIVERAGISDDYILTNTRMIKGTAPAVATTRPDQPVGTTGSVSTMYEVEGLKEAQMKPHVGRRVHIDGVFDDLEKAAANPPTATSTEDIVELEGIAIREVPGECPAARP